MQPVVPGCAWPGRFGFGKGGVGLCRGTSCEFAVGSVVVVKPAEGVELGLEVGQVVIGLGDQGERLDVVAVEPVLDRTHDGLVVGTIVERSIHRCTDGRGLRLDAISNRARGDALGCEVVQRGELREHAVRPAGHRRYHTW